MIDQQAPTFEKNSFSDSSQRAVPKLKVLLATFRSAAPSNKEPGGWMMAEQGGGGLKKIASSITPAAQRRRTFSLLVNVASALSDIFRFITCLAVVT